MPGGGAGLAAAGREGTGKEGARGGAWPRSAPAGRAPGPAGAGGAAREPGRAVAGS